MSNYLLIGLGGTGGKVLKAFCKTLSITLSPIVTSVTPVTGVIFLVP